MRKLLIVAFAFLGFAISVTPLFNNSHWVLNARGASPEGGPHGAKAQVHEDSVQYVQGETLIGIDALGRALVAVDSATKRNGLADYFFLFTAEYRLTDALSRRLWDAEIESRHGSLFVFSRASRFAAQFVLSDSIPPQRAIPAGFEYFIEERGIEIVRVPVESGLEANMVGLAVNNIESGWPEMFKSDLLGGDLSSRPPKVKDEFQQFFLGDGGSCAGSSASSPGSLLQDVCPPCDDCSAGGPGSAQCSVGGCTPGPPTECSVCCNTMSHYACCKCWQGWSCQAINRANCRCCPN